MANREPSRGELLDTMHDTVIALQDALTTLYTETLAAEQQDLTHQ